MKLFKKLLAVSGLMAVFVAGVAGPAAAEDAKAPDGKVGIHYFRPDGAYDGWGVHLWQSPNLPLPGVSWTTPMKPTGKDDFGLYWFVPADEFGDGKVNYIIHKGDNKDCTRDLSFMIKDSKEIWVNSKDCAAYTSKDDAIKARK